MILFGEIYFFVWLIILLIPAVVLGVMQKPIRYYGFMATIAFIGLSCMSDLKGIIYLLVYCIWELALTKAMLRIQEGHGRDKRIFWLFTLLSLAPLIIFKISGIMGQSIFGFMGISYLTFKSVQIIIEIYDGLIKEVRAFDFMYFLLFFPCISSGPIDRSMRFTEDIHTISTRTDYLELVGTGIFKIFHGLVYKFVLASICYQGMTYLGAYQQWWSHLSYMYCYGFYLFFDFAGYSLMAIGTGYILGVKTPENFNKPFISIDIKEFWDRWHITLSHWFRDFVFSRFMMASIRGKWFKNKLTGASIGFMINMTLMGVWHGLDWSYVLYGVYHGILLSITEIYQKRSKLYKRNKKKRWYKAISWFITFNLVMFGFFIFSGRLLKIV